MALHTIAKIRNLFLGMLFRDFVRVVARVAGVRGRTARMTFATHIVRAAVPGWKTMIEIRRFPRARALALRTLPGRMICRAFVRVATRTIILSGVIETRGLPRGCVMARGTLPREMIRRFFLRVATRTIRQPGVIHLCQFPRGCVVTRGTLTRKVICRFFLRVATRAVGLSRVIETRGLPRVRGMTL